MNQAPTAVAAWRDPDLQRRKEKLVDRVQRLLITCDRNRGLTLCEIAAAVSRQQSNVTSTLATLKERGGAHVVQGFERYCNCGAKCTKVKQIWRSGPAPTNQIPLFGGVA